MMPKLAENVQPSSLGTEVAGPAFSADGKRLLVSSQRGFGDGKDLGMTFEITGPF
jgi:secreted PhoX family phosphatase